MQRARQHLQAGGQEHVDRPADRGHTQTHVIKKRLFVALSKAVAPAEQMSPHVAEHLRYMNRLETEEFLFASGPFVEEGVLVGDGLTILQTETIEEARALMEAEPLTAGGFRQCELRP